MNRCNSRSYWLFGWLALTIGVGSHHLSAADVPPILSTTITSKADGQPQKIRYWLPPPSATPAPLLVLLHTWSGDVNQDSFLPQVVNECQGLGWAVVHPDFRGPNTRPEACASELAVQDVMDAIAWMESKALIDIERRYVVGASGGGHMTLIMAGRHPELWAAASAWVPISDLTEWHRESVERKADYAKHIVAVCGGAPGASPEVDKQYRLRSPLTYLAHAKGLPVDIQAGITDGHSGSVPVSHSLRAFNVLASANGEPERAFAKEEIVAITERQEISPQERAIAVAEKQRLHPVLLQRAAGPARLTIFDGGHEGDMTTAIRWLGQHVRTRENGKN